MAIAEKITLDLEQVSDDAFTVGFLDMGEPDTDIVFAIVGRIA